MQEIPNASSPPAEPEKQMPQEKDKEDNAPSLEKETNQALSEPTLQEEQISKEKEDPSVLLEEALENYQDGRMAWESGDLDSAMAALDNAYGLILKIELPSDSPLLQEKEDLRLLIAQRIQEIYASRYIAVGENNKTIPLVENEHITKEIKSFQNQEKEFFIEAYKRSGLYREMILEELAKAGLPEQLSWLPLIESWFNVRAYSSARALGLWQFISSTGYRFGLERDRWIDERMDPVKSAKAAVKYLSELHSLFGDWTTSLAAYNCGEFRVQRVIRSQRINYLDNFWDLYLMLPRETARFTPRFLAALLIINNPEKYGFDLPQPDPPLRFETVTINCPVSLSSLSKSLGLEPESLASLNPELRHKSTPDQEYQLKVPVGNSEKTLAAVLSLPRWIPPEATYIIHYVRRGETVSAIANRYRTSVSAIARLNPLRRNYLIRPGQRLKVPSGSGGGAVSSRSFNPTEEGEKLVYVVKRGDSLYLIARAFNTTIQKIKNLNSLKSDTLRVGQKLTIQTGKPEGATLYTVKAGDSPYIIARKFGMNLNVLLRLNGLSSRAKIYPGQKLWVTQDM